MGGPEETSDQAPQAMPRYLRAYLLICMVSWPFVSFGAIFAWDSPIDGMLDLAFRYYLTFSIWLFPLLLLASVIALRRLDRGANGSRAWLALLWAPFLSALPWIPVMFAIEILAAI